MQSKLNKSLEKGIAIILSILICLQLFQANLGLSVRAATPEIPDQFTITVSDGMQPIKDASVNIYNSGEDSILYSANTDDNGAAVFSQITSLRDDSLELSLEYSVSKIGYTDCAKTPFTVSSSSAISWDGNIDVTLVPIPTKTVEGVVTDSAIGVSGAAVTLDGYQQYSVSTGPDGSFSIPGVYDIGTYDITVQHDDYILYNGTADLNAPNIITVIPKADQVPLAFEYPTPSSIAFGTAFTNVVSGGSGTGELSYSVVSGSDVANVSDSGELSILKAGDITIQAKKEGDSSYKAALAHYSLTITTATQAALTFNNMGPVSMTYGDGGNKFSNTVSGGSGTGAITYSIISGDSASVDSSTGEVTILKSGNVTIQAIKEGDGAYNAAAAQYSLSIGIATQSALTFSISEPGNIKYGDGANKFANMAIGGSGTGAITYAIISGDSATINSSTGEVTILKAGTITVRATKAGDDCYAPTTADYSLTIIKAEQSNFTFSDVAPDDITFSSTNKTYKNVAIGGSGTGAITYSIISDTTNSTINPVNGEINYKKAGTIKVRATKSGDSCYNQIYTEYNLTILKATQSGFRFNISSPSNITYGYNSNSFINVASGGESSGQITYSIVTGLNCAEVNSVTGELTIKSSGTVTVKAVREEDEQYKSASATYQLTINKANQSGFSFANPNPSSVTFDILNTQFQNIASGGQSSQAVIYSIASGDAATVDNAGVVHITKAGIVMVKAVKPGDSCYNDVTTTYVFTINRAEQVGFGFQDTAGTFNITYGENGNKFINLASGGQSSKPIVYSISSGNAATVSSQSGEITVLKGGIVTVIATRDMDERYNAVSESYTLNIDRANQTGFSFLTQGVIDLPYGQDFINTAQGGQSTGTIGYSCSYDPNGVISINTSTGAVEINNGKYGSVTIQAIKVGDERYYDTSAQYVLNVLVQEPPTNTYTLSGEKKNGSGWFTGDVTIIPSSEYQISTSNKIRGNNWTNSLKVTKEGQEEVPVYIKNKNTKVIYDVVKITDLKLDKTAPTNLKIEYSTSVLDTILEGISFGFYNADVIVSAKADDAISGVDNFTYSCIVDSGASSINNGVANTVISADNITYSNNGKSALATFKISPQFRGKVFLQAMDVAGNSTQSLDSKVVVVDNVAPGVTVTYDNYNAQKGSVYPSNRTATIRVTEANFYEGDVNITVGSKSSVSSDYSFSNPTPTFSKNGDEYTASILFDKDAHYSFDIKYKDKSGNIYDDYTEDVFTIDKTPPTNFKIEYSTSVLDTIMEGVSFGFYNADVTVTVKADDAISGVDNFTYSCVVDSGVSSINNGVANTIISADNITYSNDGKSALATFKISPQFRGRVFLEAMDVAGNSAQSSDSKVVVVDNVAPGVTVTYDNYDAKNGSFYSTDRTATIRINEANFYEGDVEITVGSRSSVNSDYSFSNPTPTFSKSGDEYTASILFDKDAHYSFDIKCTDKSGNIYDSYNEDVFTIDKTPPTNLKIEYSSSVLDTIMEGVSFGFYNADVTVTAKADDAISGVNNFTYSCIIDSGASGTNNGVSNTIISADKITYSNDGKSALATFKISPQFRGKVFLQAMDASGNTSQITDSKVIVVDNVAPGVSVSYDNYNGLNGNFYSSNRTATIRITEANFYVGDVNITVGSKPSMNGNYSFSSPMPTFIKNGDVYTGSIVFEQDAQYSFDIKCKDKSGNVYDNYSEDVFTIDKTPPQGSIHIGNWSSSVGQMWNTFFETITFGLWTNKEVNVVIASNDNLSGVKSVKYLKSNVPLSMKQIKETSTWQEGVAGSTSFSINKDEEVIIYACIFDFSGNYTYLNSDGVIFDGTTPDVESLAPQISLSTDKPSENSLFNGDVKVNIKVVDPTINGTYSGLKNIGYQVVNMGNITDQGTLYNFEKKNPSKVDLNQEWKGEITVKAESNNSNDVIVKLTASDNAGNIITKSLPLKIDITSPKVEVSFDNNVQDSNFNGYFNNNRTATIKVIERNFDKADVKLNAIGTDGSIPQLTEWEVTNGTENKDNTIHTMKVIFSNDGDYIFDINFSDMANNKCNNINYTNSVSPNKFTIDKIDPIVSVSYNNNSAKNVNYYNAKRVATIKISEHNFDTSRVNISLSASDAGRNVNTPRVSEWHSQGDVHTATINFDKDAYYSFDVDYTDKAGNKASDFSSQSFYVDTVAPKLEIKGVKDSSANSGDVIPVISYSDTNIDNNSVGINLSGANRKEVKEDGTIRKSGNETIFTFKNFERSKEMDDMYTLTASVQDYAGNSSQQKIRFSVNRFGSTYSLDEECQSFLGKYIQSEKDIILEETNVDILEDIKITLFKDNSSRVLEKGRDYTIEEIRGNNMWHQYTYSINKSNFAEDGVYKLVVYSVDYADNKSQNIMDSKKCEINFAVDKTKPNIIVSDLETGKTYAVTNKSVAFDAKDNLKLQAIEVLLDNKNWKKWSGDEIADNKNVTDLIFEIAGDSTDSHSAKITATDAAGNMSTVDIDNFYVTTNLWVRFVNNKPVMMGSFGGITLISLASGYVVFRRKRFSK